MSDYDQTFDFNILTGHFDLISRFSDFALYISALNWFINILLSPKMYDKTFDPKVVLSHCDLISRFSVLPYISALNWYMNIFLSQFFCV